jgi:hypothetical protein
VVPDVHAPYHDKRAWGLFLQVAKALAPKHLVIIGDFMDFYAVSTHSKDPSRAYQLQREVKIGLGMLGQLDALGATNKIYVEGNHEDRFGRYLRDKAPELFGFIDVPAILDLKRRGWAHVPYKHDAQIGKVRFTHDVGVAGRNSVFRCMDMYQHSVVTGHSHHLAYIVEGNATGREQKLSAQFGWLGDRNEVHYLHRAKVNKDWALGFGFGYVNPKTGIVYLTPVPIVNYTCVVNGRLFTA